MSLMKLSGYAYASKESALLIPLFAFLSELSDAKPLC